MSEAVEIGTGSLGETEDLLARFAEAEPSRLTPAFFANLCGTHSEAAAIHACLSYVARPEGAPAERQVSEWLAKSGSYIAMLLNPGFLPVPEARHAAVACRRHDPRFLSRLQQFLTEKQPPTPVILHALSILGVFEDNDTLVPLLRILTHHESEHVRSNAAKTLCKLRPNRMLVERQLHSPDARTRANAVEGLWGIKTKEAGDIFRMAASDAHHRVAVNALVGLYYQGDKAVFERLVELSHHHSALHRAAAVWALGRLGDPRAIPALQAFGEDSRTLVRRKAADVIARLQAQAEQAAANAAESGIPSAA
ncbi:MAG: HEAT repeat domain-containing protein [Bryobacteraceae bacterium]